MKSNVEYREDVLRAQVASKLRDSYASWTNALADEEREGPLDRDEYPDEFAWMAESIVEGGQWGTSPFCFYDREEIKEMFALVSKLQDILYVGTGGN